MHALAKRSKISHRPTPHKNPSSSAQAATKIPIQPSLQSRTQKIGLVHIQRAPYYYDAAHQSALTLRTLLKSIETGKQLGTASTHELTVNAVHRLLASLCPREDDDSERHAYFSELLAMHLSELTATELSSLQSVMKKAGFDGLLTSNVVDEARYREWDFTNGSIQPKERKPLLPHEWNNLLDELGRAAAAAEKQPLPGRPLTPAEVRDARNCLSGAALSPPQSGQSILHLHAVCAAMAATLGLPAAPQTVAAAKLPSHGTMVEWKGDLLLIDQRALHSLEAAHTIHDEILFNEILRDLLELCLTRKMFGANVNPWQLSGASKKQLRLAIDDVMSHPPATPSEALVKSAAQLLSQAGRLGKLQIMPSSGGALGHAWIGDKLSIVPDKTQKKQAIGTCYMRTALRLEPDDCTVKQWPVRWLTPEENRVLHPAVYAWQITVPVQAQSLENAAAQVANQWKEEATPFRFIGTAPAMHSTACRISVLRAIEQGMEPAAKALFTYFNAGLAEPDSPTEIANRMNQFMAWVKQLAGGPVT